MLAPSTRSLQTNSYVSLILLIDNYDSFVHNLARYFRLLGHETLVVRNDQITPRAAAEMEPEAIVLSPGPGKPEHAGCCIELVKQLHKSVPILGICLGHQAIAVAFGARVGCANRPVHGQTSVVRHQQSRVFRGMANPLTVGRYHSLVVDRDTLPHYLPATAWTDDQLVMAIEHATDPVVGIQFHPESILTDAGLPLLQRFLDIADAEPSYPIADSDDQQQWIVRPPSNQLAER